MPAQYFVQQVFSATGDATLMNTNTETLMFGRFAHKEGSRTVPRGALTVGDVIRVTCTGRMTVGVDGTEDERPMAEFKLYFPPGDANLGGFTFTAKNGRLNGSVTIFFEFLLTIRANGRVAANGVGAFGNAADNVVGSGPATGPINLRNPNGNEIDLSVAFNFASNNFSVTLDQCVIEYMVAVTLPPPMDAVMEVGTINGSAPPATLALASTYAGILSSSTFYGPLYAATAYQDLGTINNTQSTTFTYQGAEGGGGVAVGTRWSDSGQQGDFAYVDTNSAPPVIRLYEMLGGWVLGSPTTSSSLSITSGNSYTLAVLDDGTNVTASMTDDVGLKSCSITAAARCPIPR